MMGFYEMLEEHKIDFDVLKEYLKSEEFLKLAGPIVDEKNNNYRVDKSVIDGLGIFSNKDFKKGDVIGYGILGNNRTLAGRYTNHSDINNANFYRVDNSKDTKLICEKDIFINEEILINYRNHLEI
jgi:SET domain-containing protein